MTGTSDHGAHEDSIKKRSDLLAESLQWIERQQSELREKTKIWVNGLDKYRLQASDIVGFINDTTSQFKGRADREIGQGAHYAEFVQTLKKTVREITISTLRAKNHSIHIIDNAVRHLDGKK